MINPVIYTFNIFGYQFPIYWYGVIVMVGAVVGTWLAEKEIARRGGNGEAIWDALVWVLPLGIVGARLWFVINATLGGNDLYINKPLEILNIRAGGLHIFGGFLIGGLVLITYLRNNRLDLWLYLDAIAPATLLGQAFARPANFINQELYGPPTTLPWGIPISQEHRLPVFSDITQYPVETTRFHPTFAYEMVLNFLIVLFLLWLSRCYKDQIKPGTVFGGWMVLAGLSRSFIEFFRPDQPRIGETFITFTMLISFLMAVAGVIFLLIRYGKIQADFAQNWEEEYSTTSRKGLSPQSKSTAVPALTKTSTPRTTRKSMAAGSGAKRAVKKTPVKKAGKPSAKPKTVKKK